MKLCTPHPLVAQRLRTLVMMPVVAAVFAVACAVGGFACASKPTVQVQHAQITGIDLTGIRVNVVIRIRNPNSFDILVRNIQAQTTIAGAYQLPPINMQPNVWLPANNTSFLTAPVVIPWHMVPGVLSATLGNEYIAYQVSGLADVTASRSFKLNVNQEPLEDHGVISREMMLQAARPQMPGVR